MSLKSIDEHLECVKKLRDTAFCDQIEEISKILIEAFKKNNRVLICGNGGSAADSQHLAAEWVNRFEKERDPFPAIALTTDTSLITSVSNDYQYKFIYSKQIQALARPGDVLIAISTSGNSENIIEAIREAKKKKVTVISFTGENKCAMDEGSDFVVHAPSKRTARIQEMHILLFHVLCEIVDQQF